MNWMTLVATIVVPSVSVIATATVAIWSKQADASTKREDRQHEIALEAEKRFGQDKVNALKTLISATLFVRRQAQQTGLALVYRRADAVITLLQVRKNLGGEEGIGELLAYAAEPVCVGVYALLDQLKAQDRVLHPWLVEQQEIGTAMEQTEDADQLSSLRRSWFETKDEIAKRSTIDLDALIALCDTVINAARDDLRGRYGTA